MNSASGGRREPVSNTRLWPFSPWTGGRGSHSAARRDHGPMAMTTTSVGIAPSSVSTAATAPSRRAMPVTAARRNSAPCAAAARIIARVKRPGSTCAVVSGVPRRSLKATASDTQGSRWRRAVTARRRTIPGISRHPPVAPVVVKLLGEARVKREAAARETLERGAVAPVARQEAAGLARRGAGDPCPLDDDRLQAAAGEEIGEALSDDAAAADHHTHAPLPSGAARGRAIASARN